MRLFTGLSIPSETAGAVDKLCRDLRAVSPVKLSWTPLEKLHITTRFIGDFPEDRLPELQQALASIINDPVDIFIHGLGWMPSAFYAAVDPVGPLVRLASATDEALEPLGIAKERRIFYPHLTLARVRRPPADAFKKFREIVAEHPDSILGKFRVNTFSLYLSASGKYTELNKFNFSSE